MIVTGFATGESWDVVDADCEHRPCFAAGFDKGTFSQGRGYTHYYDKPRQVCWTRHMQGCPHVGAHVKCGGCHSTGRVALYRVSEEPMPDLPENCAECGSADLYWLADVLPDVVACCEHPAVRSNPAASRQRCLSCGETLRGTRLELARAASLARIGAG